MMSVVDDEAASDYADESTPLRKGDLVHGPVNGGGSPSPTELEDPKGGHAGPRVASLASSVINLSNTILGAGMLGLPYAVAQCGYLFGATMLLLCACASAFGLYLLVLCSDKCGENSTYYVVAKKTFPKFAFLIDLIVFIKCFGVAISYLIIVGDTLPDVSCYFLGGRNVNSTCYPVMDATEPIDSVLLQRELWVGLSAAVIIPVAFLPTLNALQFTSALALGAVGYLLGLVIASFPVYTGDPGNSDTERGEIQPFIFSVEFFKVMTIFVFGFTCHQNIFTIYNEIVSPTHARMKIVIGTSIGTSLGVYLLIALLGYFTFGSNVADNIINSYNVDVPTTIGRILVAVLVIFSYPLQSHPDRICLDNLYRIVMDQLAGVVVGPRTTLRYVVETCVILAGTFAIGLTVADLAVVLAIVGAVGSTTMCYILPGLFFLKLYGDEKWGVMHNASVLLVAVGCIVMPTALVFVFL